jgi:hypothetical protein
MSNLSNVLEEDVTLAKNPADRRTAVRYAATGRVSCHPAGCRPGEQWVGKLRDISRTGIGLALPRRWERGTILLLELEPIGEDGPRSLCACVIHSTAHAEVGFVVGCAHSGDLSEEELIAFQPEIKPENSPDE